MLVRQFIDPETCTYNDLVADEALLLVPAMIGGMLSHRFRLGPSPSVPPGDAE